jgi:GT2 family glycosyltransferase
VRELAKLVQVGFPTHNRWDEVRTTLEGLADAGLGDLRVLIVDDGSDRPCPFDPASICPHAELRRHAESRGMVVRRNEIARAMDAPYYLGLDDDSFPVSGSLEDAVHYAERRDDLLSLAFPIHNPRLGKAQVQSVHDAPYPVRAFIGCGHMMRRDRFLQLGGFSPVFAYFLEEWEMAARGFVQGLRCVHYPALQVHHRASNAWRDWNRMDFYGARNAVLWNDWYLPPPRRAVKQARALAARLMLAARTGRGASLRGFAAGMHERTAHRGQRRPMSAAQYAEWLSMPFS